MIELTDEEGRPLWVKPSKIDVIRTADGPVTFAVIVASGIEYPVKQTVSEVRGLIGMRVPEDDEDQDD